jgi:hypothetical protein
MDKQSIKTSGSVSKALDIQVKAGRHEGSIMAKIGVRGIHP